jgi:hypothetical protein
MPHCYSQLARRIRRQQSHQLPCEVAQKEHPPSTIALPMFPFGAISSLASLFIATALTNLGDRLVQLERLRRARGGLPEELFRGHARASRLRLQMPPPHRDENGANLLR